MHIFASAIVNLRHGHSKNKHLLERNKMLWGLQVFDNISWSLEIYNITNGPDIIRTTYSVTNYTSAANMRNVDDFLQRIYNTIWDKKLNTNFITETYSTVEAHDMDQVQLKNNLKYASHNLSVDNATSRSTLQEISTLNQTREVTTNNHSVEIIEQFGYTFERKKKNIKNNEKQVKYDSKEFDILTEHLQIIESQNVNACTAGTSKKLGEGVVDNSRFQVEANVAVNRANMLTR